MSSTLVHTWDKTYITIYALVPIGLFMLVYTAPCLNVFKMAVIYKMLYKRTNLKHNNNISCQSKTDTKENKFT